MQKIMVFHFTKMLFYGICLVPQLSENVFFFSLTVFFMKSKYCNTTAIKGLCAVAQIIFVQIMVTSIIFRREECSVVCVNNGQLCRTCTYACRDTHSSSRFSVCKYQACLAPELIIHIHACVCLSPRL